MKHKSQLLLSTILCSAFIGGFSQASVAQDEEAALEEILVTASRRASQNIMTTPASITAITEKAIERYAPHDLNDIGSMVPGLSSALGSGGFKQASFAMRGVAESTIIIYKESPVGVTLDDFVMPSIQSSNLEMFDIEAIEVLRGPQGTLFGKNTTAGVINVRTKRPVMDETSVDVRLSYGSFDTKKATVAINIPLIDDVLAFRAAGMYMKSDGYYKNGATYGPLFAGLPDDAGVAGLPAGVAGTSVAGDGRTLGGDDIFSGRFKLQYEKDSFTALLQYERIRDNGDSPPLVNESAPGSTFDFWGYKGQNVDGQDPLDFAGTTPSDPANHIFMDDGHQVDIDGVYLNMDWVMDNYSFHSVSGYRKQESRLPSNYPGIPGPLSLFDASRDDNRDTFQQEFRLASQFDGNFNYVAGAFYQKNDAEFCVIQKLGFVDLFEVAPFGTFNNNGRTLCNSQDAQAFAGFVDGTYDVSDRLHLTAGLRLTHEKKEWAGRQIGFAWDIDPTITLADIDEPLDFADFERFPNGVAYNEKTWTEPTWHVVLGYDISENTFGYASYSRGFKSGGYNDQVGNALDLIAAQAAAAANPDLPDATNPTDPEIADSFEIGIKSNFDNRANIAVTGFYVKYRDAQRALNATVIDELGFETQETLFFNAANMVVYGIEAEGSVMLTDDLILTGNAAWTKGEYKEYIADTNFDGVIDVDQSDYPVERAPEFMMSANLNYTHDLADKGEVSFNTRLSHESESIVFHAVDGIPHTTLNAKTLLDATITYTDADERYHVSLLAKNITDSRYRTGSQPVANFWIMSSYGAPRYFGAEVGFKF